MHIELKFNHLGDLVGSLSAYIHTLETVASHQHSSLSKKLDLGDQVCSRYQLLLEILVPPRLL